MTIYELQQHWTGPITGRWSWRLGFDVCQEDGDLQFGTDGPPASAPHKEAHGSNHNIYLITQLTRVHTPTQVQIRQLDVYGAPPFVSA